MLEVKKHLPSIEIVRAIAALGVCVYHYSHAISPPASWSNWAFQYGYLGVQQFFVLAGMLVPMSLIRKKYDYPAFLETVRKRFWRIEPAVWASIVLFVLMDVLAILTGHGHEVQPYSVTGFLLNFLHLNAIFGYPWLRDLYWYLAIDWQFYLLCCLAVPLVSFQNRLARYAVLAVLVGAACFFPASVGWLPMYLMPFVSGIVLFYHFSGFQKLPETALMLAILLFATFQHSGAAHLAAVGLTAVIVLFFKHSSNFIATVSTISYSFYLTHLVSGWAIISLLRLVFPVFDAGILVILGTIVSLFFAKFFYKNVESRVADWSSRWNKTG